MHFGSVLAKIAEGNNSGQKRKAWNTGSQISTSDIEMSLLINLTEKIFRRKMPVSQELLVRAKRRHFQQDLVSYILPAKSLHTTQPQGHNGNACGCHQETQTLSSSNCKQPGCCQQDISSKSHIWR